MFFVVGIRQVKVFVGKRVIQTSRDEQSCKVILMVFELLVEGGFGIQLDLIFGINRYFLVLNFYS